MRSNDYVDKQLKISEIRTRKLFSIFDINNNVLTAIKENIESQGYDTAFPIVLWGHTVIDGHTRLKAAEMAGIKDIPILQKKFSNKQEALEYAIHNQRDRRNMTEGELLRCIKRLDKREERGGDHGNQYTGGKNLISNFAKSEPSRNRTASILGIGRSKVSDARTVLDSEDEEIQEQVKSGEKSISAAAKEIRGQQRQKQKEQKTISTFNQVNENIEWAKWSWNPVTGCNHGCQYCYAKNIANRFFDHGFAPHFYPERLSAPKNTKMPKGKENEIGWKNVFVCSMADLFGDWIPDEQINQVLHSVKENPQWKYLFLTKNPERYLEFEFPHHCGLGATADTQERADKALKVFKTLNHPIKFLSCEPLMEQIELSNPKAIHWLIIGGRSQSSGMPEGQPEWNWVENLLAQARHARLTVYFKPNLTVRPKEYPKELL